MSRYQSGKIYKLVDMDSSEILYIGSTTIPLSQKLSELLYNHRNNKSSSKYNFDKSNPDDMYIELLELCPCNNVEELKKKGAIITKIAQHEGEYSKGTTT